MKIGNYIVMMTVSAFSEMHEISKKDAMTLIADGEYKGYFRNNEWFIELDVSDLLDTTEELTEAFSVAGQALGLSDEAYETNHIEDFQALEQYLEDNPEILQEQLAAFREGKEDLTAGIVEEEATRAFLANHQPVDMAENMRLFMNQHAREMNALQDDLLVHEREIYREIPRSVLEKDEPDNSNFWLGVMVIGFLVAMVVAAT